MATVFDSALDRELARRFARLDWHLRRVRMIRGLGWLAAVLTLFLGAAFAVDLVFKPAAGIRVGLLAAIGITAVVSFMRAVVQPVLRKHTAAELAAVVEHAHPDLAERLTSAIELNDPTLPEEWKGSALMREMLNRQALRSAAPLDFTASVSQSRATQAALCGLAALVLLAMPALIAPRAYGLLWSRLFKPWGNFETPGNLSFLVEGGDRVVASGEDVEIKAEVRWRFSDDEPPANIRLHWRDASGTADSRQMQRDPETGGYATTLTNVFHPLDFHVAAGSDRSRSYHIDVVERPEVLTAVLDVRPPAYTGLAAHKFDGVRGELHVFERSRMQLQLTFNKPVESAEWRWLNRTSPAAGGLGRPAAPARGDEGDRSASLPLVLSSDRHSATLEWTADQGGAFAFRLTDAYVLENSREPERILVITADLPPEVSLAGSSQPRKARPDDVVRLDVQASDDIGLGALELHYEVHRGDKGLLAGDPAQVRGRELAHTFELNLAELQLGSGSVLTYRVRAADQRPVPGPNETWTDPRVISIDAQAGPPEATDVAERQQELRRLLDEIRRDLDANQAQVAEVQRAADNAATADDFARNGEIPELAGAQRELAERVETFAGRLSEHPLFANLTDDTEQVAREMLEPAARALEPAADQPLPEKAESLEKNAEHLASADQKLAEIAARFDDLARLEQELLELNRLARQAEQLAEQALDLDRRRREVPAGETPEERRVREEQLERDRQALAGEHDALMRQLDSLLERRPEILGAARQNELDRLAELSRELRELIEPQDLLAEALRDEAGRAAGETEPLAERQQALLRQAEELAERTDPRQTRLPVQPLDPELLREALAALRAGNLAEAEERQQAAADELELLAQELAKNDRLPADPQQAAAELARRQRDLDARLEAAAANAPAADAPDEEQHDHREQLRALAREQAGIQAGAAALDVPQVARERQQQGVDRAADAVEQLLANDAAQAAVSSEQAAQELEALAREIGTSEERAARAREAVAALRERQQQLAAEARRAAAAEQPDAAITEEQQQDLQALADRQREIARQVADLDAPAAEREQHSAVRSQAAALTDLARGEAADVPASQAQAEQALERLARRLAGEDLQAEPHRAADPADATNRLRPANSADQAEQLAERQQALADRTERAAQPGDVPSENERRQLGEQLDSIRRDAEQLRAGHEAADARREALEALRKADEARRAVDERAQNERPENAPASEASDELQRLMQNDARAQQNAADALQQLAERLSSEQSRQELARREQQEREQLEQLAGEGAPAAAPMNPMGVSEPVSDQQASQQQADAGTAAEAARQASELARQQRELAQQTAAQGPSQRRQNEPAAGSQDAQANAAQSEESGENPGNEAAGQQSASRQSPAEAQQQLAREAAELALDAARQTGPESEPAAQAAEFARESLQSAQQARQGRLAEAARTARQAAQSAQEAAEQLGDTPGAAGEPLGQQASDLAQRQSAQAAALEQAAESAEARRSAQQSGQEQLSDAARGLSEQLDEAARRLAADPLDLAQPAERARSSQQAAESSREAMQEAAQQIGRGNSGQAAESAQEAAERLRQSAERAAEAAGQRQPPSDVPGDVADQVAEAARQLAEARRHLAEAGNTDGQSQQAQSGQRGSPAAAQPGQPMSGQQGQPGENSGEAAQGTPSASASSQQPGQSGQAGQSAGAQAAQSQNAGQPGGPGSESSGQPGPGQSGQSASPLSQTARSLQEAARALSQVAGQCNCQGSGQGAGRGQGGGQASGQQGNAAGGAQASAGAAGEQPGGTGGANGAGGRADGPLDPATLDQELERLSARQWGQLPGHLRTEILQAARKKGNADYERLIKLYFEEIARTQPPEPNRPSGSGEPGGK